MQTTMNVSLPPELRQWVDEQVKSGGYGTASEYLRDMLRRARERESRRRVDKMLLEAGVANVVLDDADWTGLKKAARAAVSRGSKPVKTRR